MILQYRILKKILRNNFLNIYTKNFKLEILYGDLLGVIF